MIRATEPEAMPRSEVRSRRGCWDELIVLRAVALGGSKAPDVVQGSHLKPKIKYIVAVGRYVVVVERASERAAEVRPYAPAAVVAATTTTTTTTTTTAATTAAATTAATTATAATATATATAATTTRAAVPVNHILAEVN